MFALELFKNPVYFISVVVLVIFSITLHELAHALAAYTQGDTTAKDAGKFTLNPLAHMNKEALILLVLVGITWGQTPVNPSQFKHWWSDAWVSFAGPLVNLLLLVVFTVLIVFLPVDSETVFRFLIIGAVLNGVLFLLNMLPVPPLDGYAIVSTFVPPFRQYHTQFNQYGFFILLIAVFVLNADQFLFRGSEWMVEALINLLR